MIRIISGCIKLDKNFFRSEKFIVCAVLFLLGLSFFSWLFGFTGLKVFLGLIFLFLLPFYIFIDKFDFESDEKLIFSFIISLGIFSAFVYYISFLVNSMKIAIIISTIILYSLALLFRFVLVSKHKNVHQK